MAVLLTDLHRSVVEAVNCFINEAPQCFITSVSASTLTGTGPYLFMEAAIMLGLATRVLIVITEAVVASATTPMVNLRTRSITGLMTALLSLVTEATLTGTAVYLYKVAATAPQLITGVGLNTAEAIAASFTKPTLDPLTDAEPGLLTALVLTYVSTDTALTRAALTFVNTARPSVGNIIITPIKFLNTEAKVKLHAAAAVNCCATSAAAANQAALLTRYYSAASAW